jgi:MATE family multidrug resistance protein
MIPLGELRPTRGELREMVRLAWPIVLAQVGLMMMGVVDTAMVGRVSPATIAAVALGHIYWVNLTVPAVGILLVLDPVVAQAVGARDVEGVGRGVQRGILLALALSLPTALLLLPGELLFGLLRQPPDVVPVAATFSRWAIPGVIPMYLFVVFRQSLQAMASTRPLVVAIIAANLANAALNWVLIYGHLGLPALGAVGSAIATVLCRWLMLLIVVGMAWRELRPVLRPWRRESFALGPMMTMLRIGLPVGFQQWLEVGVFAGGALLVGLFGTVPLAAHEISINLAALSFMVPLGLSGAAAAMVGRAIGRGDLRAARRDAVASVAVGVAFMSVAAAVFLTLGRPLAGLFSSDEPTVALAASLMAVGAVFQLFDGVQGVSVGVLRGAADTRVPMLIHLAGFWGVGLPLAILLAFTAGLGPRGVWWAYVVSLFAVAVMQLWRVRWKLSAEVARVQVEAVNRNDRVAG